MATISAGVPQSGAVRPPAEQPSSTPAPLRVLLLARDIGTDTVLALARAAVPLFALALTSFAAQHLLTRWAASVAFDNGPLGLSILFVSVATRLVLLALAIYVAAGAVRLGGEPLTAVAARLTTRDARDRPDTFAGQVKVAIVPMVILYAAWNQVNWDIHKFLLAKYAVFQDRYDFDNPDAVRDASNINFKEGWKTYIPMAIGIWLVKVVVDKATERLNWRLLDFGIVVLECSWIVLGWLVLSPLVSQGLALLRTREVAVWVREGSERARDLVHIDIPDILGAGWALVWHVLNVISVQIVWPVVWVAVVGLLVGWTQGDLEITVGRDDARRTVRTLGGLLNTTTRGIREKYAPVASVARSLLRSGPFPLLTIAVLYAALMFAMGWFRWGVLNTIDPAGDGGQAFYDTVTSLLDAVVVPVRVCFLAACFAVVLRLQTDGRYSPYR